MCTYNSTYRVHKIVTFVPLVQPNKRLLQRAYRPTTDIKSCKNILGPLSTGKTLVIVQLFCTIDAYRQVQTVYISFFCANEYFCHCLTKERMCCWIRSNVHFARLQQAAAGFALPTRWCFLARVNMLSALYAIARPSVRPSVRPSHGWILQKRLKWGLWNFYHTVAPPSSFCAVSFIQKF